MRRPETKIVCLTSRQGIFLEYQEVHHEIHVQEFGCLIEEHMELVRR